MPRKPLLSLTAIFVMASALTACGQKGPLYLPQDAAAPQAPAAQTSTVSAAAEPRGEEDKEKTQTPQNQTDESNTDENSVEPAVEK